MLLLSSSPSPYGRKVKIAAYHLGLMDKITVEQTDTNSPNLSLFGRNPLGKIPALVLDDGSILFDSRVIVEYLDSLSSDTKIFLREGADRYKDLTLAALADGMLDASLLQVYEIRKRPEQDRSQDWLDAQAEKVTRALNAVAVDTPSLDNGITIGHITLACLLGYQDLRFDGTWREQHPNLVNWLDEFSAKVPGFEKTRATPA